MDGSVTDVHKNFATPCVFTVVPVLIKGACVHLDGLASDVRPRHVPTTVSITANATTRVSANATKATKETVVTFVMYNTEDAILKHKLVNVIL